MLKCTEATFFECEYSDINEFIKEEYGVDFEYLADQEARNDTYQVFDIAPTPLDNWEQEDVDAFMKGEDSGYICGTLLNDLCNKGRLPAGRYLVEVCW